jgi:predicted amidohydrolase YtcJ
MVKSLRTSTADVESGGARRVTEIGLLNARMAPGDAPTTVTVGRGRIAAIGRPLPAGVEAVDLDGRILLPGLWDHHVHFDQWALVRRRIDLAPARSAAAAAALVGEAQATWTDEVIEGYGYRDALWPDDPTAALLDAVAGERPVVLASGDLHSTWLNSAALRRFGFPAGTTGRVVESDAMRVLERLTAVPAGVLDRWAADAARAAATRGVVGIVDLEAPENVGSWQRRMAAGVTQLRVDSGVWSSRLEEFITAGRRTGQAVAGTAGRLRIGPFKVITDGSLNTRTAYCHDPYPGVVENRFGRLLVPPDELVPLMTRARGAGFECAIHAIGDHANSLALQAFATTGAAGRIEHAQLLSEGDAARFAALGVVASVQPEHAVDDRDVADHHWAGRTERAFPFRSLLDAGARLTLGSDAPVAPLDPWRAIAAAVWRTGDDRPGWHPEQRISVSEAIAASTAAGARAGNRPIVGVGAPADLVVVDADPWSVDAATLWALPVAATMCAGEWSYLTLS